MSMIQEVLSSWRERRRAEPDGTRNRPDPSALSDEARAAAGGRLAARPVVGTTYDSS